MNSKARKYKYLFNNSLEFISSGLDALQNSPIKCRKGEICARAGPSYTWRKKEAKILIKLKPQNQVRKYPHTQNVVITIYAELVIYTLHLIHTPHTHLHRPPVSVCVCVHTWVHVAHVARSFLHV